MLAESWRHEAPEGRLVAAIAAPPEGGREANGEEGRAEATPKAGGTVGAEQVAEDGRGR